MIGIAITRTSVRFERGDSEETRDSDGRLPTQPDGSTSRSDDWIRLGRVRTCEAEENLDSGFLGTSDDFAEGIVRPLFRQWRSIKIVNLKKNEKIAKKRLRSFFIMV